MQCGSGKNIIAFTGNDNRKQFFRGTLANFYKSKKCVIFNIDYRPGSKKSKFDMTLIRHSPFKCIKSTRFQKLYIEL